MAAISAGVVISATAQNASISLTTIGPGPAGGVNPLASLTAPQNPFAGAAPQGKPTPGVLSLSATDAIDRGLRYNLGLFTSTTQTDTARGARLRALSELLPNINARLGATEEQINLAALGFPAALSATFGFSPIVGPFSVLDARAAVTQSVLDLNLINRNRAAGENLRAAEWNYRNARELVVLVVGGLYLQVLADTARRETAQAQFNTAQALYTQAVDMKNAGVLAQIDVLRAQVEMQAQRQRVLVTNNLYERDKLALARAIGLPQSQQFTLTTQVPYSPSPEMTLEEALQRSDRNRPDALQAQALAQSAERARAAAVAEYYPSLQIGGDYGALGNNTGNMHGTFTAAAEVKIPIFQGGRVQGDVLQAEALLHQRREELADLRARIENDVRNAMLDLKSSAEQVQVAQGTVDLAEQQLVQARDRFAAGVSDNIDVIQAQEAVATAHENFISSLNTYNLAKLALARSLGIAESATKQYLGGK